MPLFCILYGNTEQIKIRILYEVKNIPLVYYTNPTADTNSRIIYKGKKLYNPYIIQKKKEKETTVQNAQKQTQKQYKTLYILPIEKWKMLLYNIDTTKDKKPKG